MEKPLISKESLLEKFPGKGGWTYAAIPEILQDKKTPFGWVKVRGSIDDYELKNYKLMPMGNGKLFLPLKAAIRKKIGKQAGDYVKVILYKDENPLEIPNELELCLKDEPLAYETFINLKEGEQKAFIDWIYSAKKDETKVERIANTINKVIKGEKLHP
ncbi:YdeI/OmpD-associated family protein [Flavobacterium sp. GSA192]|uniref:YdeI/OmpD-associated family protein n=1 Tax=Flavobacterium sp. GSA192 TaxID=2576304 RepID=UPI00112D94CE|nr:YdeI/OmpD-associated family protein [Flavobacterium sp. GSA192]